MPSASVDYFEGQSIFLTGGTGFVGLALTLKVLTSTQCRCLCLLVRGGEGYVLWEEQKDGAELITSYEQALLDLLQ